MGSLGGKVLTMDQFMRRGFSLANRCFLHGEGGENLEQLLINYPVVWGLWASLLAAIVGLGASFAG